MFVTKKHLSRRTLLKGAGVALALPFLDAMVPAATVLGQTAAARRHRFGLFYLPHGAVMNIAGFPAGDQWTPEGSGANFRLKTITVPLDPYKKYVTSFGDIKNDAVPTSVPIPPPPALVSAASVGTSTPRFPRHGSAGRNWTSACQTRQ